MPELFGVVPSAYVLLRRSGSRGREVLLQLREGTGFMDGHWQFGAAGHVEPGESVFTAAVRESAEELGVTIDACDLIPLTVVHRRHGDSDDPVNQRVDFFFACDRWDGKPEIQEQHKSKQLMWTRLGEFPTPVVPHEKVVLDGLSAGDLPHVMVNGFQGGAPRGRSVSDLMQR